MELETLESAIQATRTARDNAARAAQRASVVGIPTLGDDLALLAASYDHLLAQLLALQGELRQLAGD